MPEKIFLRYHEPLCNELQEVIARRPHWTVRIGNGIFFLFFLSLFMLSWLIRFPDTINTPATILALHSSPPHLKIDSSFYAESIVSKNESEKVKDGQQVKIRVENYPSVEYGYLPGIVQSISSLPAKKDSVLVTVFLTKGLCTNYNKHILFGNDLFAEAQILTDDKRLFDHLSGALSKVWKH